MNSPIYVTLVTVTDWPRLIWRCVAAVWVWPWRLAAAAAAAVPGMPTPALVSPRPDWTRCRGDLGPPLIRRRALEGILPFDHHLGGGVAVCRCSLSVCSLWYLELIPLQWAIQPCRKIICWFLFKLTEIHHLLIEMLLEFSKNQQANVSQCILDKAAGLFRFQVFTFHGLFCKPHLNMVSIWPDQSESLEDWGARATARNSGGSIDPNTKNIDTYARLGIDRCDWNKVDTLNIYLDIIDII